MAKGIASLTVHIPSAFRNTPGNAISTQGLSKPRWSTLEFKFYYLVALFAVPAMAWIPISLSQSTHPNYVFFFRRLSKGWISDRMVDNSDAQYRSFRNNIPILTKAMLGYLPLKYLARRLLKTSSEHTLYLMPFNMILSIIVLVALHGTSALKIALILTINFVIAKSCRESLLGPVLTWVFNGFVMFMNEIYRGYKFASISPVLAGLDSFGGAYPDWHIIFNITMLRLISFNMDYYWSCKNTDSSDVDVNQPTDKQRVTVPHPDTLYSAMNYIAYVLYPPLYIAGPIITFNDFMWQHRRNTVISTRFKIMYLIRFAVCFLTMEFILHYMYMVAIKDSKAWGGDSPAQIAMIGFWNLIIVWLKLLIPWRFFRAWALLDGIDPPENMVRCMANNYSAFGFWRSWHRSYNLWIIRYIYIPLGGSKNVILNTLLIFSFVALWHDLTFRLLAWGWLISLFVIPELAATYLLPKSKYGKFPWYRHACAIGGVLNVLMMIGANLVGFVVGTDGVAFFFGELFGTWAGIKFMVICTFCLFVGVQLMFEYREEELRQGIVRRC
ncbi:MBOAT, membrane-bound O-acyltransferase family-domain-containing protein [Panaeolus papilionaceus]|nr:MBOAT, membrane-bound O-acyltransferase family-domain-containing protein [Panaeolus papilionaceus]